MRHLARVMWTKKILLNRALKVEKINKDRLAGRSPRKPLTPKKKAILKSKFCQNYFLN